TNFFDALTPLKISALSLHDALPIYADHQGVGEDDVVRVTARLLRGGADPAELPLAVLDGREGHVELVGVPGGQPGGADGAVAADEHRDPGLDRLGQGGRPGEVVVGAVEVEGLAGAGGPQTRDDLQLLLQAAELLLREGDAVRLVLLLEPARAQPEFDASAGHLVDLGDL